jgi:hypothetical protein
MTIDALGDTPCNIQRLFAYLETKKDCNKIHTTRLSTMGQNTFPILLRLLNLLTDLFEQLRVQLLRGDIIDIVHDGS